jgi:hypothetical protein
MTTDARTFVVALGGGLAAAALATSGLMGEAIAAGPSYDITNRLRIEQDIRRSYNNYNRNVPVSPMAPRIRERHLRGDMLSPSGPSATASCAYRYGRWQRSGGKYWRERYLDCSG